MVAAPQPKGLIKHTVALGRIRGVRRQDTGGNSHQQYGDEKTANFLFMR